MIESITADDILLHAPDSARIVLEGMVFVWDCSDATCRYFTGMSRKRLRKLLGVSCRRQ